MKKNNIILLSIITFSFIGCDNSDMDNNNDINNIKNDNNNVDTTIPENSVEQISITGQVIDGYISNGSVCLDLNHNNNCDAGEPNSFTNHLGKYTLNISNIKKELLKNVNIITYGGTDASSGKKFNGILKKHFNKSSKENNINPITTLISIKNNSMNDIELSKKEICDTLDIDKNFVNKDIIKNHNKDVYFKGIRLQKTFDLFLEMNNTVIDKHTYITLLKDFVNSELKGHRKSIKQLVKSIIGKNKNDVFSQSDIENILILINMILEIDINYNNIPEEDICFLQSKIDSKRDILINSFQELKNNQIPLDMDNILEQLNVIDNRLDNNVFRILEILDIAKTDKEKQFFFDNYSEIFNINLNCNSTVVDFEIGLEYLNMKEGDKNFFYSIINEKRSSASPKNSMYYKQVKIIPNMEEEIK